MSDYKLALGRTLELAILLSEDMEGSLARDGLTRSRVEVLWELHQRGPVTQRVLAEALVVSPRNVTGLVDGLASTGFVTREPHPTDRRATLVTLTEQGTAATAKLERAQEKLANDLFSGLTRSQFDGYAEGIDAVLDRLKQLIEESRQSAVR